MGNPPSTAAADACAPPPPTTPAQPTVATVSAPAGRQAEDVNLVSAAATAAAVDVEAVDTDADSDTVADALDRVEWAGERERERVERERERTRERRWAEESHGAFFFSPPPLSLSLSGSPRAATTTTPAANHTAAAALAAGLFDGALRRSYRHASPPSSDDDDHHHHHRGARFDDDRLAALGPASSRPGGASAAARAAYTASRAARRAGARRERDKADRATVETVLDPRTRLVLFKLLNAGVFASLHGCISTGKEANVYFAVGGPATGHSALAVKVYKTSVLAFKDRHRYVAGDYRYERGYGGGGNARRMVRVWAEKEARNLSRLAAAGVPCPTVVTLRSHVLVMTLIGDAVTGDAAPRLKDAALSPRRARAAHRDVLLSTRAMYARARLVHADLSEYNLLYHGDRAVVIDVSQSVDLDHPHAFDFLRRDSATVASFFARKGVVTLSPRASFDFVTDPRPLTVEQEEAVLDAALAAAKAAAETAGSTAAPPTDAGAEAVFMAAHIPRRLGDVADHQRDTARLAEGGAAAEGIFYQALAGMTEDMTRVKEEDKEEGGDGDEEESDSDSDETDSDASSSSTASSSSRRSSRPRRPNKGARACTLPPDEAEAARVERRAAKAVVKEAARERRQTKTPKHVKKRAVAKGKKKR